MDAILSLALMFKRGFSPSSYRKLLSKYKNLGRGIEAEHIPLPDEILKARDELRKAKSMGASVIPLCSSAYPKPLKEISNPLLCFTQRERRL